MMVHNLEARHSFGRTVLLAVGAGIAFTVVPLLAVSQNPAGQASAGQASSAATVNQHDIVDTWQGTLHVGQDLRTVIKITEADGGEYKGVFYSIDQGGAPLNTDSVTLQGSDVKFTLKLIGGTFEGKLSPDGKTINGNWTQGPSPTPLVFTRTTTETAWEIPKPPSPPVPMANADPNFEVATIKPNNSNATSMQGLTLRGRNFATTASSLADLISFAYEVQAKQVVGAPSWIDQDRYDISAVPEQEGSPSPEQIRIMIRKLIADRFKLTFHHDKRELSAYVLSVGKGGQKLTPTQVNGTLPGIGIGPATGGLTLHMINATIPDFTGFLQTLVLDRPVVDKTEIKGRYDFQCTFTPDDSQFGGHPPQMPKASGTGTAEADAAAPSLFEALQQQLGLKMAAEKTEVDVIAIDHVEKPSSN